MSSRKETVLDLAKFVDKGVQVKLTGGRQVTGTLKGYDQLLNLVLDEAIEFLRDPDDPLKTSDQTRCIGLISRNSTVYGLNGCRCNATYSKGKCNAECVVGLLSCLYLQLTGPTRLLILSSSQMGRRYIHPDQTTQPWS